MKKVLITGVTSGIGLATARLLNCQQYRVSGIGRDFSALNNIDGDIIEEKITLDLSKIDALASALQTRACFTQDFDVLLLSAGYGRFGSLEQFSVQQIQHLLNTNLISQLVLLRHFLPRFKQSRGGQSIFVIGSEAALQGAKLGSVYCASKFALRGMVQSLRAECAHHNIRLVLINPGPVDTPFFDQLHFAPHRGEQYALSAGNIAQLIVQTASLPAHMVCEEINVQSMKRAFHKKDK